MVCNCIAAWISINPSDSQQYSSMDFNQSFGLAAILFVEELSFAQPPEYNDERMIYLGPTDGFVYKTNS
jgi:hypothetical protein